MHSEKVAGASALNKKPPFFLYTCGPESVFQWQVGGSTCPAGKVGSVEVVLRKALIRSGPIPATKWEDRERSGWRAARSDGGGRSGEHPSSTAILAEAHGHSRFREL